MKKILSAILALCMIVSITACSSENESSVKGSENKVMRDITTQELIEDMGLGINLGNTFESCGNWINKSSVTNYETAWGSPVITEQMIKGYKDCGFGVMRLPVAWSNMMDKETYTISPDYIARVKEVLNWALDSDLYVILNIHYDNGWFSDFADDKKRDECFKKYEAIWKQLCEEFGDYGDHLMFESLNEEGGWEELWNRYSNEGDKEKSYSILNEINQKFVDIVRASGKITVSAICLSQDTIPILTLPVTSFTRCLPIRKTAVQYRYTIIHLRPLPYLKRTQAGARHRQRGAVKPTKSCSQSIWIC